MTKVDAWMPYYGADIEQALKGYPPQVKWSYVAALWHYWHHNHCVGLPTDDEYLRNICDCKEADWMRTRGVIFGIFFKLVDGVWHQKRSQELHADAMQITEKRSDAGKTAAAARWSKQPDAMQSQSERITAPHTTAITKPCHPQPQPQSQLKQQVQTSEGPAPITTEVELPAGFPTTLDEAKVAAMFVGCTPEVVEKAWHKAVSRGGRDSKDVPIRNWRSYLSTEWGYEQARLAETSGKCKIVKPQGAPTYKQVKEYGFDKIEDCPSRDKWIANFYHYWNDESRNWKRKDKLIDWKVEFSTTIAKWREQRS